MPRHGRRKTRTSSRVPEFRSRGTQRSSSWRKTETRKNSDEFEGAGISVARNSAEFFLAQKPRREKLGRVRVCQKFRSRRTRLSFSGAATASDGTRASSRTRVPVPRRDRVVERSLADKGIRGAPSCSHSTVDVAPPWPFSPSRALPVRTSSGTRTKAILRPNPSNSSTRRDLARDRDRRRRLHVRADRTRRVVFRGERVLTSQEGVRRPPPRSPATGPTLRGPGLDRPRLPPSGPPPAAASPARRVLDRVQ